MRYQIPDTRHKMSEARGKKPIHATLKIYNVLGQEVRTLVDEVKEPGYHTATWDGRDCFGNDVASGIYFYRLTAGGFTAAERMVLLR
ncbi:MAG: FlgD immunoglobulin-like domain containing protein [bacterium]